MSITTLIYHHGHKKGLVKVVDESFGKGRGKYRGIFRARKPKWYQKEITGTPEELERAYKVAEEYFYKILNYAEKDELIPKEDLDEARRIFAFAKQGPRAHHFLISKDSKLTSADVLYILTTTVPGAQIAKRFNLNYDDVLDIRAGRAPSWEWEYHFIKRIKTIVKHYLTKTRDLNRRVYTLSKVNSPNNKEILLYTTSIRKAKELRESIITKLEMKRLIKDNSLDILYPIEAIEVL